MAMVEPAKVRIDGSAARLIQHAAVTDATDSARCDAPR
jgi:hypothetical protein